MIAYSVSADTEQLSGAIKLFEFIGGNTANAIRIAINKTLPQVKSMSSKKIGEQVALKADYIKSKLTESRATRDNLVGRIYAEKRGILLSHFDTTARDSLARGIVFPDAPIKVQVNPSQTKNVTGAKSPVAVTGSPFLFRLKNVRDGIGYGIGMFRVADGKRGGRIQAFYSSSVSQVFRDVKDEVAPEADRIYSYELLNAMQYVLRQQYAPE